MRSYLLAILSSLLFFLVGCTEEEEPRFVEVVLTVINQASGAPISGAEYEMNTSNGLSFRGSTDARGLIEVSFEANGEVSLGVVISHPSFTSSAANDIVIGAAQTRVSRTFELTPDFQVTVAPSSLLFGASNDQLELTLTNGGTIDVQYRIIAEAPEVSVDLPTGMLVGGSNQILRFSLDRTMLSPGLSAGTLLIVVDELGLDLQVSYSYRVLTPEETNWVDEDKDGLVDIRNIDDLYRLSLEMGRDTFLTVRGFELLKSLDFDNEEDYVSDTLQNFLTTGEGWLPIGIEDDDFFPFEFHGNGHEIVSFYMHREIPYASLFAFVGNTGSIKDLKVSIKSLQVGNFGSGLVGLNLGTIENCSVEGTIESTGSNVGLLIGRHQEGKVFRCYSEGAVIASGDDIGGLIGLLGTNRDDEWEISNSYADVIVRGRQRVGGLVGSTYWGSGVIHACYAKGDVLATSQQVGGLVGQLDYGSISSCYAMGDASSNLYYVGGLVGDNTRTITTSFSTGKVIATSNFGGFIGRNSGSVTARNYWDVTTSEQETSTSDARGLTTVQLQGQTTANGIYITWDPLAWDFGTISQYPALKGMPNGLEAQRN